MQFRHAIHAYLAISEMQNLTAMTHSLASSPVYDNFKVMLKSDKKLPKKFPNSVYGNLLVCSFDLIF